nr:antitoxin [Propionibacterium sp.]
MTENPTPGSRDVVSEAKAALERLRGYAAGHSAELTGAIDRLGDFIDKQTGGRFADKIDKAQDFARRQVDSLGAPAPAAPPAPDAPAADPFSLDDEQTAAPSWKQPPGQAEHAFAASAQTAKAELDAAIVRLRTFAAEHKENLTGLVDKVGDFVDAQTGGRYAERIDHLQASAKERLDKALRQPGGGAPTA